MSPSNFASIVILIAGMLGATLLIHAPLLGFCFIGIVGWSAVHILTHSKK